MHEPGFTKGSICFSGVINEQTVCEADRSTGGAGLRVNPEEKEEQTVCEADKEHRRCGFASKSGGEERANDLRSRQGAPEVRVCE